MSILIIGENMPDEDEERFIRISPDGSVMTMYGSPIPGEKAFQVPWHGRLGDLDALEKILKEKQAKYKARDLLATHELSEAMRMGFDAAVGHVLLAPTIIPAEEG